MPALMAFSRVFCVHAEKPIILDTSPSHRAAQYTAAGVSIPPLSPDLTAIPLPCGAVCGGALGTLPPIGIHMGGPTGKRTSGPSP